MTNEERKNLAKDYIRAVYGGNLDTVDRLADESILTSYPVFEQLFGSPVLRGRSAVKKFAEGFHTRWKDANITFHETIAEGLHVALIWSFQAVRVDTGQQHHWGGITWIRFDESGKIRSEIGEESEPGPAARANIP